MLDLLLMSNLATWANIPPQPDGGIRSLSQAEKIAHLEKWRPVLKARQKLVAAFRPREGEIDVFIQAWTGERLAYPSCNTEQLLTPEEIEIFNQDDPDDPILELMSEGWNAAREVFRVAVKEQQAHG